MYASGSGRRERKIFVLLRFRFPILTGGGGGEGEGGYRWFVTFPGSHFGMYASRSRGKAHGIYVLAPSVVQFSLSGVRGLGFLFTLYLGRRRLW